ncbi:UvrD-helicase domain-containing protein [Pseudophaeobacter arcticus]|uniref:UvrD-helicase domain-containing protein n=1 Tax=Pseudophaeobacter arcticus TaxID=385492 RepID=UPI000425D5D2|nr:UvrD-helicase domain-containing protein [Pseudophaeobacter arcticus]
MPKALVIAEEALVSLNVSLIDETWTENFEIPANTVGLRRVEFDDCIYILAEASKEDSRFVIVDVDILAKVEFPADTLSRIFRAGICKFDRTSALPTNWQPFHEGPIFSIYVSNSRTSRQRLHFYQRAKDTEHLFVFLVTPDAVPFRGISPNYGVFDRAVSGILDALVAEVVAPAETFGEFGILLSEHDGLGLGFDGLLNEWYNSKLNTAQRDFVTRDHSGPVRLRGAAGTGKTQAMAVKCLWDLYTDADGDNQKTFAFITHSSALAHDVVRRLFLVLDPTQRWEKLTTSEGRPKLWIGTLYDLAQERMSYERKGLTPLSTDGLEGREFQMDFIQDAISKIGKNPRHALPLRAKVKNLSAVFTPEGPGPSLLQDIANEIACVLDADRVRKGHDSGKNYLTARRESWQMPLETRADRELMLEIYDAYRAELQSHKLFGMDQMISDFERYLVSHEWDHLRETQGFDVIFVDEYHYFNRIETMIFHNLFAPRAAVNGSLPLFMAYDLKQSISDGALNAGAARFRNPKVGESKQVELQQVYRSTGEIVSFLRQIDGAFPALNLEGELASELEQYSGKSERELGAVPEIWEFDKNIELIDKVVADAKAETVRLQGRGRQVAVLCMSMDMFRIYREAGRIKENVVRVESREDLDQLRYAKRKCVLSMPEYVAGLQFETVYLIHVDAADWATHDLSVGAKRRYLSRLYLGASRAANRLILVSSHERGGASPILSGLYQANSPDREN